MIEYWRKTLAEQGLSGELIFCRDSDIQGRNECVYVEDKRLHILLDQGMLSPMSVYNSQSINYLCVVNGPFGHIIGNKMNFALLNEPNVKSLFSPEEQELIDSFIPFTRLIDENFKSSDRNRIIDEKDKYVLKIADGASGHEIFIGKEAESDHWKELLSNASTSRQSYVIQEFIESQSFTYLSHESELVNHNLVWGFFVFGDQYAGSVLRTSDKKDGLVINSYLNKGTKKGYMLEVLK